MKETLKLLFATIKKNIANPATLYSIIAMILTHTQAFMYVFLSVLKRITIIFSLPYLINHQQATLYCTSLAIMAFNARISDPIVGGTYLTLLNTLTNLGGNWCQTLALWLVDGLTWTNCTGATIPGRHCSSKTSAKVQAIILQR